MTFAWHHDLIRCSDLFSYSTVRTDAENGPSTASSRWRSTRIGASCKEKAE